MSGPCLLSWTPLEGSVSKSKLLGETSKSVNGVAKLVQALRSGISFIWPSCQPRTSPRQTLGPSSLHHHAPLSALLSRFVFCAPSGAGITNRSRLVSPRTHRPSFEVMVPRTVMQVRLDPISDMPQKLTQSLYPAIRELESFTQTPNRAGPG